MQLAANRRIYTDYTVGTHYSAGLELLGSEVKSIRSGGANLTGSQIIVRAGEAYIIGLKIRPYQKSSKQNEEQDRTVKLLLTKRQLAELYEIDKNKEGFILPLGLYADNQNAFIKVDIGICKKLQKHDKRQKIKERDLNRYDA